MKAVSCLMVLLCLSLAGAEPEDQIKRADEKTLVAWAMRLSEDEAAMSRRALRQSGSPEVRQLAGHLASDEELAGQTLAQWARELGVAHPRPVSRMLAQRWNVIWRLRGEGFDADYLLLLLDFHREGMLVYEELSREATRAPLRQFARDSLLRQREHYRAVQKLAAPVAPDVYP